MADFVSVAASRGITWRIPKARLLAAGFWLARGVFLPEDRELARNNSCVATTMTACPSAAHMLSM
jgi:hypothetical protein